MVQSGQRIAQNVWTLNESAIRADKRRVTLSSKVRGGECSASQTQTGPHREARGARLIGGAQRLGRPTLIALRDLTPGQLASWSELAQRAVEPNPFFEPEFVLPAARHLDAGHVALLVARDGAGEWLACMPVARHITYGRRRLPVFAAWRDPRYGCLGTPLVARSAVQVGVERLLEQALRASRAGVVALPLLGDDGPVAEGLRLALAAHGRRPAWRRGVKRAVMHRSTLEGGTAGLVTSRHRRDLGRLARRLSETLGAPLEATETSSLDGAVERFLTLEEAGWKGSRRTALICDHAHTLFFREMCAGFRAAGRLQLLELGTPETTVSAKCNLLSGEGVFCFRIAFDSAFAHFRPGLQLELRMLEVFRESMSQSFIDSCASPDSKLFANLWPERRPIGSYLVAANGAVSWAVRQGIAHLTSLDPD